MTLIQAGLGPRLGDVRESGETGDSREEDTQWRQAPTLYTRILRTFVGLANDCDLHFAQCIMNYAVY